MADDEVSYMICADVASIDGCVPATCVKCGIEVQVSPTGQDIMREENALPVCIPCGTKGLEKEWEEEGEVKLQPLRPEQIHEVLGQILSDQADDRRN